MSLSAQLNPEYLLGDKALGVSVKVLSERVNGGGKPVLNEGSAIPRAGVLTADAM